MKKTFLRIVSIILVATLSTSMILISASAVDNPTENETTPTKYQKISMESITGLGSNPEEISGNASSAAAQKQWYEYIMYSPQPVSSIRIDDNRRLVFYDPYDYGTSMIMKVTGEESEWSTANSMSVSYTTGNTLTDSSGYSTNTSTSTQVQEGRDENFSHSSGTSTSTTDGWSNNFSATLGSKLSTKESVSTTVGTKVGSKVGANVGVGSAEVSTEASASATVSIDVSAEISASATAGGSDSHSDVSGTSDSKTDGWSTIANRVTTSAGSSTSTNTSWSTNNSKTVNRTFSAGYYNSSGAPLPWKIVQYTVYMPLKYELQCKFDGEWYSTDSDYCILTTIQGTCRAYMQNTQTYVEHWGTGEPVLWDDFWGRFFTEDKLIKAYQNKLYPNN